MASKVPIGRGLYSDNIIAQADGRPIHMADRTPSDGRFRVLIFAGDIKKNPKNVELLYDFQDLIDSQDFFAKKFTPINAFANSVIDIVTIHASNRHDVEILTSQSLPIHWITSVVAITGDYIPVLVKLIMKVMLTFTLPMGLTRKKVLLLFYVQTPMLL